MNTYLVSFADLAEEQCWIKKFTATGFQHCVSKISQYLNEEYNLDIMCDNYHDLKEELRDSDIIIGSIIDLDEL